ncbi:MAG TPA: TOMM precursor leader peptide-binding protein [Candidatus Baltobacteraceae bacterium]|nr:TOMM precursor leader peptide-binding protein [Candidatus Baltobacteraceae bacterium]
MFITGAGRITAVNGPSSAIASFIRTFQDEAGSNFEDAFRSLEDLEGTKTSREQFKKLFDSLVGSSLLKPNVAVPKTFRRAIVVSRFDLELTENHIERSSAEVLCTHVLGRHQDGATLSSFIDGATQSDVVLAVGLHEHEFYALNRRLAPSSIPWVFIECSTRKAVVSPILRAGRFACYECLRLRRLGTLRDIMQNSILEERVSRGLTPEVSALRELTTPEREMIRALLLRRLYTSEVAMEDAFLFADFSNGTVSAIPCAHIPECAVCSSS